MNENKVKYMIKEKLETVETLKDKEDLVYVLIFDDADERDIYEIRESVDWHSIFKNSRLIISNTSLKNIDKKVILKKLDLGEKE